MRIRGVEQDCPNGESDARECEEVAGELPTPEVSPPLVDFLVQADRLLHDQQCRDVIRRWALLQADGQAWPTNIDSLAIRAERARRVGVLSWAMRGE